MAKGRGLWLDSVGDRTGKRRVGRPSKSHCLENLVWLTDGLERSLERAHSRLWGGDSNAADTANQVSIAPREGAIFTANQWEERGAKISIRAPRGGDFSKIALCRRPSLSIFSQMAKTQRNFSLFLQFNLQKGGRSCFSAGANPSGKCCALGLRTARISAVLSRQSLVWHRCAPPCSDSGSPDCKSAGCPSPGR